MLETTEQYDYTRTYIMGYIVELINKKGIRRTDVLQQIYDDINNVGYVESMYQLKFLLKFVRQDFNHANTKLELFLKDMKRFKVKQQRETTGRTTLENFFV